MHPSSPFCKLSSSSKKWLSRHFKDPYVKRRMLDNPGFRSRSAFKLLEMDQLYHFLKGFRYHKNPNITQPRVIIDLGAAPGGWSQVAASKTGHSLVSEAKAKGPQSDSWSNSTDAPTNKERLSTIIALDLDRMEHINGVTSLQADFLSPVAEVLIRSHLPPEYRLQSVDLLLSDMAANATGNSTADNARSLEISQAVFQFACRHLTIRKGDDSGGAMILKHFQHPDSTQFCTRYLRPSFCSVYNFKPPSSRYESSERFWICLGFLGYHGRFKAPKLPEGEVGEDLRNFPRPDFTN